MTRRECSPRRDRVFYWALCALKHVATTRSVAGLTQRRAVARALGVLIVGIAIAGCGGSNAGTVTTAVVGGAPVRTPESSPKYCRALTSAKSLVGLASALNTLATNPRNATAKATIRRAAMAVRIAAPQAPPRQRSALIALASAIRHLGSRGLRTARHLAGTLERAGHLLRGSCAFPAG